MRLRRARQDAPTVPMAAPRPSALEYYGARMLPDLSGWWVYALGACDDGRIFYVGQSNNLISRLRDWSYQHKDLYDPAKVYLIPVGNEARACVVELELIDHYQPERNQVGKTDELRAKVYLLSKPAIGGWNARLDRKQAAN